jgi:cytoskeleton-associated protein 5
LNFPKAGSLGEIGQVLKARVTDTNKAVQTLALDIVCRIASGMGKPFEKHTRLFILPVCTVLADQKAPIRSAATQVLSAMAGACEGLDSMTSGIGTALESPNPLQKGTLLHWLVEWVKDHPPNVSLDVNGWVGPVLSCLDDRSGEVRKGAQLLLPTLVQCAGYDYVMHQTNSLKPASRTSIVPLIQNARPPASEAPTKASQVTNGSPAISASTSASTEITEPAAAPSKAPTKSFGVRRKLPLGSRPDSRSETPTEGGAPKNKLLESKRTAATENIQAVSTSALLPIHGTNQEARKNRCGKDASKWINEGGPTRKDLCDLLQLQMESHTSKEVLSKLFSRGHDAVNDFISGMVIIADFYSRTSEDADDSVSAICLANFDLPLKYAAIRVHEPQPNLVTKCLELVESVLSFLRMTDHQLTDGEALSFIPTMIYKVRLNCSFLARFLSF